MAAYVAVHLGYARLEKELLGRSCCVIAEPVVPEPGNQGEEKVKTSQPSQASSTNSLTGKPQAQSTYNGQNSEEQRSASLPAEGQSVNNKNPDFQVIIRRNIFQLVQEEQPINTDPQPVAAKETTPEEVPTTLNLTLLGTVLGDEHTSRAIIIEEKQNEQKLYQIGDAVQGAIIESIERGKVVLEVFGAKETLMMKKREGGGPGPPRLPNRVSKPQPRPAPTPMEDNIEDLNEDELVEEKQVRTSRKPPSIRPHRRINFRRNPIRNVTPDMGAEEEEMMNEEEGAELPILDEELPPLD
ncbi:MAG: type II secretion system protein N [Candidatus Electrothrix communis]|nr:MAG: type II secretion system protein N [Candidatus Electrothrix communis]